MGVVALALLVALAAWSCKRHGAQVDPPTGAAAIVPSVDRVAEAVASDSPVGTLDKPAAIARYEKYRLCLRAKMGRAFFEANPGKIDWIDRPPALYDEKSPELREMREAQIAAVRSWAAAIDQAGANCAGIRQPLEAKAMYEVALQAALAGDTEAASCYVSLSFPMSQDFGNDAAAALRYRQNARKLIDAGMANGDWRMVGIELQAHDARRADWLGALEVDDPVAIYKLRRLEALGAAEPALRVQLEQIAEMERTRVDGRQAAAADREAQAMFASSFRGRATRPREIVLCNL